MAYVISPEVSSVISTLLADARVKKALEFIEKDHGNRVEQQKAIALVQGETGKEHLARTPMYKKMLQEHQVADIEQDSVANVYGRVYGSKGKGRGKYVLLDAHLDTVFLESTPLAITEKDGRIYCPGIGDDAGGLAVNLQILRALRHAGLQTVGNVLVSGTACEESNGDFRGIRKLIADHGKDISALIFVDGQSNTRCAWAFVGVRRAEFIFRGPGGHSWRKAGTPACIHAMCRGLAAISEFKLSSDPKTTVNIGVIQAGNSVGAIGAEARVHMDMRSLSMKELDELDKRVVAAFEAGIKAEGEFRGKPGEITMERVSMGDIPTGTTAIDDPLIQSACAATEAVGEQYDIGISSAGCNHGCIASYNGIPAVAVGYGGINGNNHALDENFDPTDAYKASQKALLILLAMAGLEGVTKPLAKL